MKITEVRVGSRVADSCQPSRRGVVVEVLSRSLKVQWYDLESMPIVTYSSSQARRLEKLR